LVGVSSLAPFLIGPRGALLQQRATNQAESVLNEAIAVQQIAAPTFAEHRRAEYVAERLRALPGVRDVATDKLDNVYARLPGDDPNVPAVLVTAHTDTVFDTETDLTVRRLPDRVMGPGLGDNSLGVAAMLALPSLLSDQPHRADLWLVANSREEGLGDLGGIRAVLERLGTRVGSCIVLEGMAYGQVYHAGIAVRRLRISVSAPGGHSWLHFGQPSAIHCLVRIAAQITQLSVPESPRTTYNIGVIEGGRSVNSIATDAAFTLDLRSEETDALMALEKAVRDFCASPDGLFGCGVRIEVVGDRPAGKLPLTHPLVDAARLALEATGVHPAFRAGSTDANWPLSLGIPAITVGITRGSNAHRLDEYIEVAPIGSGLWQTALITLVAAAGLG